jgi:dihydropyrimidinase
MRTLIKNGTIVTAVDTYAADLWIEDGRISAILSPGGFGGAPPQADRIIDAAGRFILPGGIDAHTHLDMPFGGTMSADDFETGTRAAAHGGTTTIVDFAIQTKGKSFRHGLEEWHKKAEGKAAIDYGFHVIATDVNDQTVEEIPALVAEGVSSFKLFTAYPGSLMTDDMSIFRALKKARDAGALTMMHAENGNAIAVLVKEALARGETAPKYHALTRPEIAEAEATYRTIALAEMAGAPVYIVHLTAPRALEHIVRAQDAGLPVFAETCPQYLFTSLDDISREGFEGAMYVCSPPVRDKSAWPEIWRGIKTGHIQVVSTDHCPFRMGDQKVMGKDDFSKIPNGMASIETRLHLMWDGGVGTKKISMNRFVEITSTAPAKLFGLGRKGTIAVGYDADLLIWDANHEHVLDHDKLHMAVDHSPYQGRKVKGAAEYVLSRGKVIVEKYGYVGKKGDGRFVKRAPFQVI